MISDLKRLFGHVRPQRKAQLAGLFGLMLAGAAAEGLTVGLALLFCQAISGQEPGLFKVLEQTQDLSAESAAMLLAGVLCAAFLAATAARLAIIWGINTFSFGLGSEIACSAYERTLYQPYRAHLKQNSSELVAGINKVHMLVQHMALPLLNGISSTSTVISIFLGLVLINPAVAFAAVLLVTPAYLAVTLATRRALRGNGVIIADAQARRLKTVSEGLGGIRDVIVQHAQPLYLDIFAREERALRKAQAGNGALRNGPRYVLEALGLLVLVALTMVLSQRQGGLLAALPLVGAFALGALRLLPHANYMYGAWAEVSGTRRMLTDMLHLLDRPADLKHAGTVMREPFAEAVRLEAVDFRYGPQEPLVLRGVDLVIAKGSRVGLMGKSGSGKTTLVDLLLGLLEPTSGTLSIDGRPLTPERVHGWQAQIGHVPQHIYLLDGSLAQNIAFSTSEAAIDLDRVREAARRAGLAEFIESRPEGYQATVGERGVRLSGGQLQRVGIARALYRQAEVLIFDEATSALDEETEAAILAGIEGLGRDLTLVFVAHRLSTLRGCDVVHRLEKGRLVHAEAAARPAEPAR